MTDKNGKVIKTYEYDSFGNEVKPDSKNENPFRYCGEYYDKETEEIYLRARYYKPEVGRFLTRDTYTGEEDEALSLHLYTYCENDGINYKVGTDMDFWEVYIRQKNEKKVREVNFFKRVNGKRNVYETNTVSNNVKKFYPQLEGSILVDKNNRVLFTGSSTCDYFVHHKSKKQCNKAYRPKPPYINKVVKKMLRRHGGIIKCLPM